MSLRIGRVVSTRSASREDEECLSGVAANASVPPPYRPKGNPPDNFSDPEKLSVFQRSITMGQTFIERSAQIAGAAAHIDGFPQSPSIGDADGSQAPHIRGKAVLSLNVAKNLFVSRAVQDVMLVRY